MGEVLSPLAAGSPATGRRVASPCQWLLLGGGHGYSRCGFTGHEETSRLAVPVVTAREEWPAREFQSPPAADSPDSGRQVASPCRWLLLGRIGQRGRPRCSARHRAPPTRLGGFLPA